MFNLTGTTLGRYQITERIGRGGMADVYKATHTRLGTYAAIKILYSHLVEQEDFMARFEREAKSAAGLRHPHIVRVFDYDIENELSYIVMDYIDGGTLKEWILHAQQGGGHMTMPEVMHVFRQVAEALDYAHQQGMIHRDVKSANILLDQNGSAYLTDFGIAHIVSSTHLTSTGSLIGTPMYMSPEQCQGKKATTASDIYSLGMVLYEMLTGKVPFAEDTPLAVIHKHIYEPLPSPREYRADLAQAVEQVVLKALAREPEERYASAQVFLEALSAAVQEDFEPRTVAISSRPPTEPTPEVEASEPAPPSEEEPDPQQTVADLSSRDFMEPPDFDQHIPPAAPEGGEALPVLPTDLEGEQDATVVDESPITPPASPPTEMQQAPPDQGSEAVTVVSEDLPLPPKEETKPQPPAPPKKRSTGWTLAIIVAAAAVIMLLVAWATGVFSGYNPNSPELCNSPGDCLNTAWFFKEQGDVQGVRAALTRMERLIPPEREQEIAFMFCEGGEIYAQMGKPGPARDYFQRCLEFAPDEDLRNYAREMLSRID